MTDISLGLNYDQCVEHLKSLEDWLGSSDVRQGFEVLKKVLQSQGGKARIGVFGSSWSGYMAYNLIRNLNIGNIELIFESREPLYELEHVRHVNLSRIDKPIELDCVLLAVAPRHYKVVSELVRAKVNSPCLVSMYEEVEVEELPPADVFLEVHTRFGGIEDVEKLPLLSKHMALVLIDIWDFGKDKCPYCHSVPPLLEMARQLDWTIIHAPTYSVDEHGKFLLKEIQAPQVSSITWPPVDFRCKQGRFAYRDVYARSLAVDERIPVGIHSCSTPMRRDREYVESSLEGVLDILAENKVLHVLYAGGGVLCCLVFKPAGYPNVGTHGYQVIPVRDAVGQDPAQYEGHSVDMVGPGIVTAEFLCGYSTTLKALQAAFMDRPEDR